jgi:formylglycine-generating enzyme required for sulfatase activity
MRSKYWFLFLLLFPAGFGTPLHAQQKQKQQATQQQQAKPKPAAPAKPKPAKPVQTQPAKTDYAYLLVTTDLEVEISVNFGTPYPVSPKEEGRRIPLEQGDNVIKVKPLDGGSDGYTETITLTQKANKAFAITLAAKRLAAQQAEVERRENERRAVETQKEEARQATIRQQEALRQQEAKKVEEVWQKIVADIEDDMVRVNGGTFSMGSTYRPTRTYAGDKWEEGPVHNVTLRSYYIGKYEVTHAQWRAVIGKSALSKFYKCDECPVENVSWKEVQRFLEKLNEHADDRKYRLPTEAEWEYAARGGDQSLGYTYVGSDDLESVAWFGGGYNNQKPHPVGQLQPNELDLYDMSGNVSEWCSDWYWDYPAKSLVNPAGPETGSERVHRGGSYASTQDKCRVTRRDGNGVQYGGDYYGFRLVRSY